MYREITPSSLLEGYTYSYVFLSLSYSIIIIIIIIIIINIQMKITMPSFIITHCYSIILI